MIKRKNLLRTILVAGLYALLTLLVPNLSYGPIQFRFADMLTMLCYYNPFYIPALVLGCFIANLFSPLGPIDLVFGCFHSLASCYLMSRTKNIFLASLWPAILSPILACQIVVATAEPLSLIMVSLSIFASEFVSVSIIGIVSFKLLTLVSPHFRDRVLGYDPEL